MEPPEQLNGPSIYVDRLALVFCGCQLFLIICHRGLLKQELCLRESAESCVGKDTDESQASTGLNHLDYGGSLSEACLVQPLKELVSSILSATRLFNRETLLR